MPKFEDIPTVGTPNPGEKMVKVRVLSVNFHTVGRVFVQGDVLIVPEGDIEKATNRRFDISSNTYPIICRAIAPVEDPESEALRIRLENSPRNVKAIEGERARFAEQNRQREEAAAIHRKLDEDEARRRGFVPVREASAAGK